MQEPKIKNFNDFKGGYRPDYGNLVEVPGWRKLFNLYLDSEEQVYGRPHLKATGFSNITGIGISHDNQLVVASNGTLYIGNSPVAGITGSGRLSFDYQTDRTIVCTGGQPVLWDGINTKQIPRTNIYSLATAGGAYKARLYAVDTENRKRLWVSEALDPSDFAETFLTDPSGIADDKKTSGGRFYGFSHDILDIREYDNKIVILTEKAFYSMVDALDNTIENVGYFPTLVREYDIDVYDAKPARLTKALLFLNGTGIYLYPEFDRVPMTGIERTIRALLINGNSHISVDRMRRLIYLCPDDSTPETYIFHVDWKMWTKWDIGIKDCVLIDNVTYAHTVDDNLYTLEDTKFAGLVPYDITIQSGLSGFDNPSTRKRFKSLSVEFQSEDQFNYFLDILTEKIDLDSIAMNQLLDPTDRIDTNVGGQSERGSIICIFTNYGQFRLSNIMVNYAEKQPRIPLGLSPI